MMPPRKRQAIATPFNKSEALPALRKMFADGEFTGNERPSEVKKSHPIFHGYNTQTFNRRFKRLSEEFGLPAKTAAGNSLQPRSTDALYAIMGTPPTTQRETVDCDDGGGAEILLGRMDFMPLHVCATWTCARTLASRVSVSILVPSGVSPEDLNISVAEGGEYLFVQASWPDALQNPRVVHEMWIEDSDPRTYIAAHNKMIAFEKSIKELKRKKSETLKSTAKIALPCAVEPGSKKQQYVGFPDESGKYDVPTNCLLLYIELDVLEEKYDDSPPNDTIINARKRRSGQSGTDGGPPSSGASGSGNGGAQE